jgi:hypothetical protein
MDPLMSMDWDALSGTTHYMGMTQFQSGEDYVPGFVLRNGVSLVARLYVIRKNDQRLDLISRAAERDKEVHI